MFNQQNLHNSLQDLGVQEFGTIYDALQASYTESGRYYHTDQHINECLSQFQALRALADYPAEIEVAIWFHDAIYDTTQSDNEARSADWAKQFLTAASVDESSILRIVNMIVATKTHETISKDSVLLLDIDLGILGADATVFEAYDQAIRREFHWVPEAQYRIARAQILQAFLDRDSIYQTEPLKQRLEAQARQNLTTKIQQLKQ